MTDEREDQSQERRDHRKTIADVEATFRRELQEHESREHAATAQLIDQLKVEAFPDGPQKHREAHQAMIDAANQEAEFWRTLKIKMAEKSIWGILQLLIFLVAAGIAAKFGLGSLVTGVLPK